MLRLIPDPSGQSRAYYYIPMEIAQTLEILCALLGTPWYTQFLRDHWDYSEITQAEGTGRTRYSESRRTTLDPIMLPRLDRDQVFQYMAIRSRGHFLSALRPNFDGGFPPIHATLEEVTMNTAASPVDMSSGEKSKFLVPELSPNGQPRLWKTRYLEVEKLCHQKMAEAEIANDKALRALEQYRNLEKDYMNATGKLAQLEATAADAKRLQDRMMALAKRANVTIHQSREWEHMTLEDQLDQFFGAMLCRLRLTEEVQDELAD